MIKLFLYIFLILFFKLSSFCIYALENNSITLQKVDYIDLINWDKDNLLNAFQSFINSCVVIQKMPSDKVLSKELNIQVANLQEVCNIAINSNIFLNEDAKNFFETYFNPFLVLDKNNNDYGLFTGYYKTSINGSKIRNDKYKYPIYKRPLDLGSEPYYTREEIENGILKNQGLELLYTDSKVDLLFLQIQGSGKVVFEDNTYINLVFDGKNNRQYTSVGSILIKKGYMKQEDVNAISIKEWFNKNPDKIDEIINQNQSYIFFKEGKDNFTRGSIGAVLTPMRSIAIDYNIMPYGCPFWLDTEMKVDGLNRKFRKLVIAQDTGSAIKGSVRADIFFGEGEEAKYLASNMNFKGKYYILIPKQK